MAISANIIDHHQGSVWTAKELATAARVSIQTIYNWVHSGDLESLDLPGGVVRIPDHAARRLLGLTEEVAA
jgi:predicted site-specific integrase-resolvase